MSRTDHDTPAFHIAICGGGLAAYMTAAALSRHLPPDYRLTLIITDENPPADIFYGSVTSPTAYNFNLSIGLSEPDLIRGGNTAFSWGTHYQAWGKERRDWIQGFQLPLPVLGGVQFHQYLADRDNEALEPYLVSAAAARLGVFAHPPETDGHSLARAEYGYQFSPAAYREAMSSVIDRARLSVIAAAITEVDRLAHDIRQVRLSDGRSVSADLFIDCTGPEAALIGRMGADMIGGKALGAALSQTPSRTLGPATRVLTGQAFGWQAVTPLQGASTKLTLYAMEDEIAALVAHGAVDVVARAVCGRRSAAWIGNCVAIGQAAGVVDPLTPAPLMLLQRDVERLLALIPVSSDLAMERREFNRQFANDHDHAELFRGALLASPPEDAGAYWQGEKHPMKGSTGRSRSFSAGAYWSLTIWNPLHRKTG
ncbi:MAG: tryptophan 7-halogenase [Asticcacaulis sp.]|nr:tryptophan 7-halogenase [Asticcacaulis sp.]